MEKIKMIFPKLSGERLIFVALMMILATELIAYFWHPAISDVDTINSVSKYITQKSSLPNVLVDRLALCGYFLLTISLISTGIRLIRNKWSNFKGMAMTVIGICFFLYHLLSIQAYTKIGNTLDELTRPHFEKMEMMKSKLEKDDMPLKSKVTLSKMYASDKFVYEGAIVDYLSQTAEKTRFSPTKEDVKLRELIINSKKTRKIWDYNNRRLAIIFWCWIAVAVVSLLLGVLTPLQISTPSQRSDHERA